MPSVLSVPQRMAAISNKMTMSKTMINAIMLSFSPSREKDAHVKLLFKTLSQRFEAWRQRLLQTHYVITFG
jgi:hypothetical protein